MEQVLMEIRAVLAQLPHLDELARYAPLFAAILPVGYLLRRLSRRRGNLPKPFEIHSPYVIDGDTLAKGKLRIRLFGIDAPETGQRQGKAATRHLRHLIGQGSVRILPRDIDHHGRLVAQVMKGEIDLCRKMVADGYAVACTDYTSLYAAQQSRARRTRAGLWRYGAIQNPTRYRRQNG